MYTAVLVLALTAGADSMDHGRRGGGCGCYGGCYGGGYCGCYGGGYCGCYGGYSGYWCGGYCGGGFCGGYGGGYRTGYGYGGGYYGGGYGYASYPSYNSMPMYGYSSDYYTPNMMTQQPGTVLSQSFYRGAGGNSATVRVILPSADAEIWFDNSATQQRGMERIFHTPGLESGKYSYTVKAKWNDNGRAVEQERRVEVQPGQMAMVDFRAENLNPPGDRKTETLPQPNK